MQKLIFLKEYENHSLDEIKNACDLSKFHHYLKKCGIDEAVKIYPWCIKSQHYVGVIKFKKLQIQILPKMISKSDDEGQIIKNLLYMLSYTKNLNIKTPDCAVLSKHKNIFLEVLIREFANSLFESLKKSTPRNYIRKEENLNFLKGKLKFIENIKYNFVNKTKFYCEYDEFSENNELNRLFLFVSNILYNLSSDNKNKKTLKFIINYYSDITFDIFNKAKAQKIKLSRNQKIFIKPFGLAKMFIEKLSVDLSKNKIENISLIWDMNKLFEEFIYEFLRKEFQDKKIKIHPQKPKRLLKDDKRTKKNTYVDIFIENGAEKIILDTKYKKLETMNDVENADIYQVSTYCLIHGAKNAILLYPKYQNEMNEEFKLNKEGEEYNIKFVTINLKFDDLKDKKEKLKERLDNLISPGEEKCLETT